MDIHKTKQNEQYKEQSNKEVDLHVAKLCMYISEIDVIIFRANLIARMISAIIIVIRKNSTLRI